MCITILTNKQILANTMRKLEAAAIKLAEVQVDVLASVATMRYLEGKIKDDVEQTNIDKESTRWDSSSDSGSGGATPADELI